MAILAVAFVVLAAVPAALTDSDAATSSWKAKDSSAGVTEITGDTEDTSGGAYFVGKDLNDKKLTVDTTAVTLYITKEAKIQIVAKSTGTINVFLAEKLTSGKASFYEDSQIVLETKTAAALVQVNNGGLKITTVDSGVTVKAQADQQENLITVTNTTDKYTQVWTTGMAAAAGNLSVTLGKSDTATFIEATADDTYEFSMKVTGASGSAATVAGPLVASDSGTITIADDGSTYKVTGTQELTEGLITREAGTLELETMTISGTSGTAGHLANGVVIGTGAKIQDPAKVDFSANASNITVLKNTTLTKDAVIKASAATSAKDNIVLGAGLKTSGYLNVTTAGVITSKEPWTGAAIQIKDGITAVDLSEADKIGSLTVASYGQSKVAVTTGSGMEIWGTLTVNDNQKTPHEEGTCNTLALEEAIVTESGSVVLGENVELAITTSITVLGSLSGEGEIAEDSLDVDIYTQDGKKSNISVSNADELTGDVEQAEANDLIATDTIDNAAEQGFKIINLGILPINKTYTFPEDVTIKAGKNAITIASNKDSPVTVTLPSSTKLELEGTSVPAGGIIIGSITDATDSYATLIVEGELIGTGYVYGAGAFELASTGRIQDSGISILTQTASGDDVAQEFSGRSLSVPYPVYQKQIVPEGKTITVQSWSQVELYGALQVDGTLVIEKNASLKLGLEETGIDEIDSTGGSAAKYIPQGATVTISSTGSIVIEEDGEIDLANASVTSSGNVQLDGKMLIGYPSSLTVKSAMTESSTGVIGMLNDEKSEATFTVSSSGVLTLEGYLGYYGTKADEDYSVVKILNSGSVIVDNASIEDRSMANVGNLEVSLRASGASVVVDSYITENAKNAITVNDSGLAVAKFGSTNYYATEIVGTKSSKKIAEEDLSNEVQVGADKADVEVTGELTIASEVTTVGADDTLYVYDRMLVSGSVSNGSSADKNGDKDPAFVKTTAKQPSETVKVTDSNRAYEYAVFCSSVAVDDEDVLVVGADIALTNAGLMDVDGYLDMTADDVSELTNSGEITVTGEVKIKTKDIKGGKINAVKYILKEAVGSSTATYNVYTTLDQAVEDILAETNTNTDKTITIYGKVELDQSVTVKSPISVKFDKTTAATNYLKVGSKDNSDVVLTFEPDTKFTSNKNQVDVYGTLYFADKTNDSTNKTICDVMVESDDSVDRMYTNIYTALASAESGDTVKVTREATDSDGKDQYVELTRSVTIGEGVTLKDASGVAALWLADGVTMTVNGTLDSANDVYAESRFDVTASLLKNKESSAVVVNGTVKGCTYTYGSSTDGTYVKMSAGAPIAGAYYTVDSTKYLSTVEIAQKNFSKVNGTVSIYGPVVTGDLSFAKTSSSTGTTVAIKTSALADTALTASSITVDEVSVVVENGAKLSTVVKNDSASVTVSKITGTDLTIADKSGVLSLSGTATASKDTVLDVTSGTVQAGLSGTSGSFTYTATKDTDKAMTVASGATLVPESMTIDKLTVNGTFSVPQNKGASVGTLVDLGTVSVFAGDETSSGSTLNVTSLWIGTSASDIQTGAAASFAGPVAISKMAVVLNGASVDSEAQKVLDKIINKTEFYVNNTLWITVYDNQATASVVIGDFDKPVITNAYFAGWYNTDGESAAKAIVGSTGFDKVYASIYTKVYHVEIKADQGIGDLYLNGNIMSKGFKIVDTNSTADGKSEYYYAYWADVEAGDYEVTCKLANGYGGTAVLKNTDGSVVSNNKFTASGTPETDKGISLNFQLTGIAKTGYVQPAEEKDDDTGMGITDYLLIVLVILVVVLAVIVALRLMRS